MASTDTVIDIDEEKATITKEIVFDYDSKAFIFECPHCNGIIEVKKTQIASKVCRHAVLKSTGKPINPHAPKEECLKLVEDDLIWGCGKPFRFIKDKTKSTGWSHVETCEYI